MESKSATRLINQVFTLMAAMGVVIAIIGLGLDLLPGSSPGISTPQLMMIVGGVVFCTIGFALRRASLRQSLMGDLLKNLAISLVVVVMMLIVLEIGLGFANIKTRYPTDVPETFLTAVSWWTCDDAGCHYEYAHMQAACENKEVSGRRCMVNRQGFHDSQDFVASDDRQDKLRVLMLGDSFTFGGSATIGNSFVETLEAQLPDAVVWNTGIPGAGTNQALAALKVYAPIMQPQVTILGFYMNDYDDNMFPVDSYFMGVDETNYPYAIRQYMTDEQGEVTKLDSQADLYYRFHQVDPPRNAIERFVGTTRLGSLLLNTVEATSNVISKSSGTRVNAQVDATRQYLTEIRDYAADHDIELILLMIPRREDVAEMGVLLQNTIQLADELNILYINPVSILDANVDYAPDPDIHWSTAGHQKVAELLIRCLSKFEVDGTVNTCNTIIDG